MSKLKKLLKNWGHTLESCWLCIRFPFLYPRNRFTNRHWNSWKIQKYLYGSKETTTWKNGQTIIIPATEGLFNKAYNVIYKSDSTNPLKTTLIRKSLLYVIWFQIIKFIYNYILPIFHCIPTYTELDAMPEGWRKAFGLQMCDEIKQQLKKDKMLYNYRIMQIKEKWGGLRWYDAGSSRELNNIINKYENLSYDICIVCGAPATKISSGWICPYCDEHYDDYNIIYQQKINGKWEITEEYKEALKRIDEQYAKNK